MYQGSTTLTGDEHNGYHNKPLNSYENYSLSCSLLLQYTMSALGHVNILYLKTIYFSVHHNLNCQNKQWVSMNKSATFDHVNNPHTENNI